MRYKIYREKVIPSRNKVPVGKESNDLEELKRWIDAQSIGTYHILDTLEGRFCYERRREP